MTRHLEAVPPPASNAGLRRIAAAMSEAELQQNVADLCKTLGLFHYHPASSIGSEKGWPDSTIIGPGGIRFRELKSEIGRPTPEQVAVGYRLKAIGMSWKLWRPSDWLAKRIEAELREICGTAELF